MSKERTDKSKYKSPSTDEYCTAAQWVAEVITTRVAKKEKVGSLPYKFWNEGKWNKTYKWQVVCANRLIKQFGERTVIRFVRDNKYVISLGAKFVKRKLELLKPIIDAEIEREKEAISKAEKVEQAEKDGAGIKRTAGKKSVASRLK